MAKSRVHLSKTALLKPKIKSIDVDDGFISIRALSASYAISLRGKTLGDVEIYDMLAKSICGEDGDLLLTPEEIGQLALSTLSQVVKAVMAFNSMGEGAVASVVDELKKTEDLTMSLHERLEAEGL